jgi:hypothetical protein
MSKGSSLRPQFPRLLDLLLLMLVAGVAASPSLEGAGNDVVATNGKLRSLGPGCSIDRCDSNSAKARLSCCDGFVCTNTVDIDPDTVDIDPERCVRQAIVGCTDESWCYDTLTAALDAGHNSIFIKNGVYTHDTTIKITRPHVHIVGESKEGTILVYNGTTTVLLIVDTHDVTVTGV